MIACGEQKVVCGEGSERIWSLKRPRLSQIMPRLNGEIRIENSFRQATHRQNTTILICYFDGRITLAIL